MYAYHTMLVITGAVERLREIIDEFIIDMKSVLKWKRDNAITLHLDKSQMLCVGFPTSIRKAGQISINVEGTVI